MNVSDKIHCLFSGTVKRKDGTLVVEVPEREITTGEIEVDDTYRIAMLPSKRAPDTTETKASSANYPAGLEKQPDLESAPGDGISSDPPISHGDVRTVTIEDIGEQGDGIARVDRGFVVFVPGTELGEKVRIRITDVKENIAFADVIKRIS